MFVGLFLVGCAGMDAKPKSTFDRFTGATINTTDGNTLPNHFPENFTMTLDMRQEIKDSSTNYFLVVGCISIEGIQFTPGFGESLFVVADTNRFAFTIGALMQRSAFGGQHFYPATEEQLRKIASANAAEVRLVSITGNHWDRKLAAKNMSNFREFMDKYLPKPPGVGNIML